MRQIKEAIELLEKAKDNYNAVTKDTYINKALAKLKAEQPPAGKFREIVNNRFPVFLPDNYEGMKSFCKKLADTINDASDIIDQQKADLDQKDKLLFAYESVRAPKQPPAGDFRETVSKFLREFETVDEARNLYGVRDILQEACDRLDRSEASRKDLRDNLKMLVALLCHPGSFVSAEDIEKAKVAIEKEGGK